MLISPVSTLCEHRLHSVLRGICDALRENIVDLSGPAFYFIPLLVLSPISRDSVTKVCESLLAYLTYSMHVELVRDFIGNFEGQSKIHTLF